ncbi:MAG: hypothetical protein GC131_04655 [Alphaproteobacteria bacterium]|nr:hypothetical protein [Alphaproteobacteria bacterium]
MVPLLRPALPTATQLSPYLRRIDKARWYSNFGELQGELETRLARHFNVLRENIALFANGTLALTCALQAMNRGSGTCLMPSWTFAATPGAAIAAGMKVHFADVHADTWALDPDTTAQRTDLHKFSAIVAVSPFGAALDHVAWEKFTAKTGLPVLIDGAAAFDSVATKKNAAIGNTPVMISLHATKCFGIGEGGLLLSRNPEFIARARQWGNFGFLGAPVADLPGGNAKLSEYGAAIGLAALDNWGWRRRQLAQAAAAYAGKIAKVPGIKTAPGFNDGSVSNSCNVLTPMPAPKLAEQLAAAGISTRRWWGDGCHAHPAYKNLMRDPMPVTDKLARHTIGLPFFHDLDRAGMQQVVNALTTALESQ